MPLCLLLSALLAAPPGAEAGVTVVHQTPLDIAGARIRGLSPLPFGRGLLAGSGTVVSPAIEAEFPFNDLVASWNADIPADASLRMEARVRRAGRWTKWYKLARWEKGAPSSFGKQEDADGSVDVDSLRLKRKADAFRYRITLVSSRKRPARLTRAAAAYADTTVDPVSKRRFRQGPWVRELKVPRRSQMTVKADYRKSICSPVSVSMILAFWGRDIPIPRMVKAARDRETGLYGNWPLNVAAAAAEGLAGHVARLPSLEALQDEIAAGRPVAVSITFAKGGLSGAPLKQTRGHLLVVTGFTSKGDVIVNDPAAPSSATVRRVYKRREFARVWLNNKHGIAYVLAERFPMELAVGMPAADLRVKPSLEPDRSRADGGLLTQALRGERVTVLSAKGDWVRVRLPMQPHWDGARWSGYPGWMRADALFTPSAGRRPGARTLSRGPRPKRIPRKRVVELARRFRGDPYVLGGCLSGGTRNDGVDCSCLVHLAYRGAGIEVPRDAAHQHLRARRVSPGALKPGDLVFLTESERSSFINHVLLYTGGEKMLEARMSAGKTVETTFPDRFGKRLRALRPGELVTDNTRRKPFKRRVYFGSLLEKP